MNWEVLFRILVIGSIVGYFVWVVYYKDKK